MDSLRLWKTLNVVEKDLESELLSSDSKTVRFRLELRILGANFPQE